MSLIISWIAYPLVLGLLLLGWGCLLGRLCRVTVPPALLLPFGMAALVVVGGMLTAFSGTAPLAVPVAVAGALGGLAWARPWAALRAAGPALAAAALVMLAYGAPVILTGHATFLGYLRLDDTSTWFDVIDEITRYGRSVSGLPQSTYTLVFSGDVGPAYPLGAFVVPALSRAVTGIDIAWVFQPYLAACGAVVAMGIYELAGPLVAQPRRRAALAAIAAQPALLYGYSLWGGIKELTAAALLVTMIAAIAPLVRGRVPTGRELIPAGMSAGALGVTLGAGAAGWVLPAFAAVIFAWVWGAREQLAAQASSLAQAAGALGLTTAFCMIPVWIVLSTFFTRDAGVFASGQNAATRLGNLIEPLSPFQLAGVWWNGDFRVRAAAFPTGPLVALVVACAAVAVVLSVRRQEFGIATFTGVALLGVAIYYLVGATPWVTGKALAISSPALLAAGMLGAGMLWERARWAGLLGVVLGGAVLWSNVLAYHDALPAPRDRLAELQHIGTLVGGHGPTFLNDYEVYGDRHFLRDGAPVEPAEYRIPGLPTRGGALLVKTGYADLDAFPLSTLLPYPSIVIRHSPVESRPPSIYHLVWAGRFYELWQRGPSTSALLAHTPFGDSNALPYCGAAENGPTLPLCAAAPAAIPGCPTLRALGAQAARSAATLVAYVRPQPIVLRGDQVLWPGSWYHDAAGHSLTPSTPGTAVAHIQISTPGTYALWLGGTFSRGFSVNFDNTDLGAVRNEISDINGYVRVTRLRLLAGVHVLRLTYPEAGLAPGSGNNTFTSLSEIVLAPLGGPQGIARVAPAQAASLCGRSLDWVDLVR